MVIKEQGIFLCDPHKKILGILGAPMDTYKYHKQYDPAIMEQRATMNFLHKNVKIEPNLFWAILRLRTIEGFKDVEM